MAPVSAFFFIPFLFQLDFRKAWILSHVPAYPPFLVLALPVSRLGCATAIGRLEDLVMRTPGAFRSMLTCCCPRPRRWPDSTSYFSDVFFFLFFFFFFFPPMSYL